MGIIYVYKLFHTAKSMFCSSSYIGNVDFLVKTANDWRTVETVVETTMTHDHFYTEISSV